MTKSNETKYYPAIQFRIARPTRRLQEVIRFYCEGLQLDILFSFKNHEGYSGVMIGLPGIHYHLEFTQDNKSTEHKAPTNDNLLVLYFPDIEALNGIRTSLEHLGYLPVYPENPYWHDKGWTYEDPEGWRVVLYHGTFLLQ